MWSVDRHESSSIGNNAAEGSAAEDRHRHFNRTASSNGAVAAVDSSSTMIATLDRHAAFVNRIACDPTGSLLVSTSDDMTACLWDVRSGSSAAQFDIGEANGGHAAAPSVLYQQDGHDITSVNNTVFAVDFHPDGAAFATSDFAGVVLVWDARSGVKVGRCGVTHTGRATCLHWLSTGFHLATGGDDGIVHLYDTRQWATPLFSVAAHTDTITSISSGGFNLYSHSSGGGGGYGGVVPQWMATTGLDGRCGIWSADDGSLLRYLEGAPVQKGFSAMGGADGGGIRFALPVVVPTASSSSALAAGGSSSRSAVGLFVGGRDRFWSVWGPSSFGATHVINEVAEKRLANVSVGGAVVSGSCKADPNSNNNNNNADKASDSSDSSDDDNGLGALRKKPRTENTNCATTVGLSQSMPPPPPAAAVVGGSSDDSDSDDDALSMLRKK